MKKFISFILAVVMLTSMCCALAVGPEDARAVIGANLSDEQIAEVYKAFGVERGSVKELTVTNAEEREYLEGLVDESLIGTRSISCVYIETLEAGSGISVSCQNITWCTQEIYTNALVTAGVTDAKVIVAAPIAVSGTAALTGIYKAYEDATGEELDVTAKEVGTQELVLTTELADEIGSYDATAIVNELKLILDETKNMTDDEIRAEIKTIAEEYDVSLTDAQIDKLIELCRALEKLDDNALIEKVKQVQDTVKKIAEAKEKADGFVGKVKNVIGSISDFFANLFSFFKK